MKINALSLSNFLCHEQFNLGLNRLTIVAGPNGSGKSAIKDAIQFALTGKAQRQLIRYGAKKAQVILDADGIFIERQLTASGQKMTLTLNGDEVPGTMTNKQARLMEYLGVSERVIDAVLNTQRFLELGDDERKRLVFDAMDIAVTRENLKAWLERQRDDIDFEAILDQLEEQQQWEYDDIKGNRKFATEMRRQFKREFNQVSARLDALHDVPEDIEGQLKKAQKKLDELQQQLNKLFEQRGAAEGKQIKQITDEIDQLQQKKEQVLQQLGELSEKRAILQRDIELLEDEIARMSRLGKVCVLSEEIPCPMKKGQVTQIVGDRKKQRDKWKKELTALEKKMEPLKKQRAELENAIQELVKQKAEARWEDPQLEKQIRELEFRIQKGKNYIAELMQKQAAAQERENLEERMQTLQLKIEVWDLLEKAYGERGVRAELLRTRLDGLQQRANETAEVLGFGSIEFVTQDGNKEVFRVTVDGHPAENFSRGEQHAIGLVMQDALAFTSGLRLLVLDEANVFVEGLRERVNMLFVKLMDDYDTILILKAADEPLPAVGMDRITTVWMGEAVEVA